MVRFKRETGSLAPKPQGNPGRGKLTGVKGWVERRIAAQPDLTIDALTAELAAEHGVMVSAVADVAAATIIAIAPEAVQRPRVIVLTSMGLSSSFGTAKRFMDRH